MEKASYNRVQYGLIFVLEAIHAYVRVENMEMDIHSITICGWWKYEGLKNVCAPFCVSLQRMGTVSVIKKGKNSQSPILENALPGLGCARRGPSPREASAWFCSFQPEWRTLTAVFPYTP